MKTARIIEHIVHWLKDYSDNSLTGGFVLGISGGIDSAVTSVLCAMTGKRTIVLNLPIRQGKNEFERGNEHISWLKKKYPNVESHELNLTKVFESCEETFPADIQEHLVMANTRARLRMMSLYAFAARYNLLVAGTGNKVEDFGVGFFTKYGDGGVDLSPIADLYKTEVFMIGQEMGIIDAIQKASPTDGLFDDGRTDEEQIGASYPELEWAMNYMENKENYALNTRQKHVMEIFMARHKANQHKMLPIPVCSIPRELKSNHFK